MERHPCAHQSPITLRNRAPRYRSEAGFARAVPGAVVGGGPKSESPAGAGVAGTGAGATGAGAGGTAGTTAGGGRSRCRRLRDSSNWPEPSPHPAGHLHGQQRAVLLDQLHWRAGRQLDLPKLRLDIHRLRQHQRRARRRGRGRLWRLRGRRIDRRHARINRWGCRASSSVGGVAAASSRRYCAGVGVVSPRCGRRVCATPARDSPRAASLPAPDSSVRPVSRCRQRRRLRFSRRRLSSAPPSRQTQQGQNQHPEEHPASQRRHGRRAPRLHHHRRALDQFLRYLRAGGKLEFALRLLGQELREFLRDGREENSSPPPRARRRPNADDARRG